MKIDVTRPGFAFSVLGHLALLAVVVTSFSLCSVMSVLGFMLPSSLVSQVCSATLIDDNGTPEAVPIETITQNDFNQIMKGEKSSKEVTKTPTTKADKLAEIDEQHALPPNPEAQRETPPPPPKASAPTSPVPTPPVPPPPAPPLPPVPEPPQRPEPTPPAPTPPLPPDVPPPPKPDPKPAPKPAPVRPAPPAPVPPERDPDAEVIKQAPPPPPKPVPKPPEPPRPPEPQKRAEVKPPPVPPKPAPTPPVPQKVVEKTPPAPPKVPERPAPKKPDLMAKLLDQTQDDADPTPEPAPKTAPKPAPHAKPAPAPRRTAAADTTAEPSDSHAFDPTDISKILNAQPSAQPAGAPPSTGHALSKTASRGATSGNSPKMSPSQSDALDGLLADQFKQCWSYLGLDHGRYIPEIKVAYAPDGSLQSEPQLLNRPSDPNARSLAESALRAVRQCNPLKIPAQFSPFYDQWRSRILRFDPAEMSG